MAQKSDIYLGNKNLKRNDVQVEWTKELVNEFLKCSRDPVYFVETYVKLRPCIGDMNSNHQIIVVHSISRKTEDLYQPSTRPLCTQYCRQEGNLHALHKF